MGDQTLFETACKQGRLAITRDRVALQRGRPGRGRATWTLPRSTVSGMSSQLAGSRYELTIHTQGGRRFTLDGVAPVDTLKSVALLGYVRPSERDWRPGPSLPATYRCKGGQLELTAERIALRPRLFSRRPAWSLAREEVTGVSLRRLRGVGLLHDLVIYTRAGAAHTVERVPAPDALGLTRALGFAPQSPPVGHVPVQPRPVVVTQPQPRPTPTMAAQVASGQHPRVRQDTVGALWRAYGDEEQDERPLRPSPAAAGAVGLPAGCGVLAALILLLAAALGVVFAKDSPIGHAALLAPLPAHHIITPMPQTPQPAVNPHP